MPTVVALIVDRRERERIAPVLRPFGDVRFCDRPVEVWQAIGGSDVVAFVTDALDRDGRSVAPTAEELHRLFPTLPIVVHSAVDDPEHRHALRALALTPGVADLNGYRDMDLSATVRDRLTSARVQSAASALLDVVATTPSLDPLVCTYIRTVVRELHWPLSVGCVMEAIDSTKRRTLESQLKAANLPTAEQIIGWVFALHATWLRVLPGSTLEAVARRLGFNDSSTLRSVFTNRIRMPSTEVMRRGGFHYLLNRFSALLRGDWALEPPRKWRPAVNNRVGPTD